MKPTVVLAARALSLSFLLACSAKSGSEGDSPGTGASPSTGSAGSLSLPTGTAGGVSLEPISDAGGSGGGAPVANGECAQQNIVVGSKPADVLLVLDRSKSMIENNVPPNGATRWAAVVPAVTAVISATDASVSWGLKLFPEGEGSACSAATVTDAVPAPIMPNNAGAVNAIINATMALGNGTPTGEAITKATEYLKTRNVSNQYIVLATDGDPSCPSDSAAETLALSAIADAKAAGFPTYVIGVLDPVKDKSKFTVLNAMAEAGGTALSDNPVAPKFFQAYSQEELTNALKKVTGQVVSCVFELASKPPAPENIAVKVNGVWLEQDKTKAQGWDYTSDQYGSLELHGDACQQVKNASENKVDIIFGCKGMPIMIPK